MQSRNGSHIRGIDVSHWQGEIDWQKVKDAGIQFAYVKATEGTSFVDPAFIKNVSGAKDAGIMVGAYHYAHPDNDAEQEVSHFLKHVDVTKLDLPPALDLETNKGLNRTQVSQFALRWLNALEQRTGIMPIFYSYTDFIRNYITKDLAKWPLWIAHYNVTTPGENGIWDRWEIFQYSDAGNVTGIKGKVDLNVMEVSFYERYRKGDAQSEYRLNPEDANKIIRFLSAGYFVVQGNKAAEAEFHRLANELRKASGQLKE